MFKLFFSPSGRISRGQYWLVHLAVIPLFIFAFVPLFAGGKSETTAIMQSLGLLAAILPLNFWFSFCATAKRYHDRGKSAWWYLMIFVPYVGGIWHFIECGCLAGDSGPNDYGPPPGVAAHSTYDDAHYTANIQTSERYEQAIQNALLAQNSTSSAAPQYSHPKPTQQYHDRPRDGRPIFGKRI